MAIAPERNPPINPEYYQPRRYEIEDITLGTSTLIETTVAHDYVIGQLIRLLVPSVYGSYQLNNVTGYVIAIPEDNQVLVDIDSSNSNYFISSPAYAPNSPQIVAVGDINSGYISNTGANIPLSNLNIPGSFINISPL